MAVPYPNHEDPDKGTVLGGECNRTACDRHGATWWNNRTVRYYCKSCAMEINRGWEQMFSRPTCVDHATEEYYENLEKEL